MPGHTDPWAAVQQRIKALEGAIVKFKRTQTSWTPTLTPEEEQNVLSILREEVCKQKDEAAMRHAIGGAADPKRLWHLGHADDLVVAIKKLFPDFLP